MTIRISRLQIENFRGLVDTTVDFGQINFVVGDNGAGKTSCLAAIARLMPMLRGEKRIFLDADFRFRRDGSTSRIRLVYELDCISEGRQTQKVRFEVTADRKNTGTMRSHLNDQVSATMKISCSDEQCINAYVNAPAPLDMPRQRIVRNGWGGGRIAPISLDDDDHPKHAATSEGEEAGYFDSLRARLVQLLKKSELGARVDQSHPSLLGNVLNFTNQFLGEEQFLDVALGHSDQLAIHCAGDMTQPWAEVSSGERAALNLAMAIEFEKRKPSQILIIEEPETNMHPSIQREFVDTIKVHLPDRQIFIATHSPYIFERYMDEGRLLIAQRVAGKPNISNANESLRLFSEMSWGEISYYAYNLCTFEFHNELYGWIQESTGNDTIRRVERFFSDTFGIPKDKVWIRSSKGEIVHSDVTIMTYIRNFIHHPENTHNAAYTDIELAESIATMIDIVKKQKKFG